jgi:hypothetical protein
VQGHRGDEHRASNPQELPFAQEGVTEDAQPVRVVVQRVDPIVPVETGHSSCTVCTIGNIACELGRPLKWDPINQVFDDPKANSKLHYRYRGDYKLDL